MKRYVAKAMAALTALSVVGCSSYSPEDDLYGDNSRCHGEVEVSHSVTIYSSDESKSGTSEVTEKCVPKEQGMLTDFEKENQRQDID